MMWTRLSAGVRSISSATAKRTKGFRMMPLRTYLQDCQSGYENLYSAPRFRLDWMTDTQWQQVVEYLHGRAIPEDAELCTGLADPSPDKGRAHHWAYTSVPAFLVGPPAFDASGPVGFEAWCDLIQKSSFLYFDADL